MSSTLDTSYLGEIRLFAGRYAPSGWAMCDGGLLSVEEYYMLFNLLGTTYGGDGENTFALPDLRRRVPVGHGRGPDLTPRDLGTAAGDEVVLLMSADLPPHRHVQMASLGDGRSPVPTGLLPATPAGPAVGTKFYAVSGANAVVPYAMAGASIAGAGGGQPHPNMMPYACVNFIIQLNGLYPNSN